MKGIEALFVCWYRRLSSSSDGEPFKQLLDLLLLLGSNVAQGIAAESSGDARGP